MRAPGSGIGAADDVGDDLISPWRNDQGNRIFTRGPVLASEPDRETGWVSGVIRQDD